MSKVLVFGGAGFVGSHVADELTRRSYEVSIFDWNRSQYLLPSQNMIIGDILNRDAVRNAVKDAEIVYHFAAMADIQEARDNPVESANFNIIGTMNILDACREYGIKRFVYSSTIYVYSDHGSFYRSSKQACELFIENYHKEYNIDFTILRYGSLYGKRANNFNFIRNCIRQALLEGKIVRNGDGEEIRDYVNILDAARSSVDALDQEYRNSYLMITGPQSMKVKELLFMIKEIMGDEIELVYTKGAMVGHYKITPYSFKPKVALKLMPKDFHDLGQGVLDSIYEIYQDLLDEGFTPKLFQKRQMINNSTKYIYLSYFMDHTTPLYGGGKGISISPDRSILNGDTANTKQLIFQNHSGTHIDFPNHFFENGKTCENYSADFWVFEKPFLVLRKAEENEIFCLSDDEMKMIPDEIDFLIIKTGYGEFRGEEKYWKYNPGFAPIFANNLREKFPNLKVIGMDFISLTSYQNRELGREAHRMFLGGDRPILLIEDMDLSKIMISPKSISCLPLLINGLDGSPVTIIASI